MSRFVHVLNAGLWMANAVLWAFWAHAPAMGVASALAAIGSAWLARQEP